MTTSNVVDVSRKEAEEKSPEQIQLEIARTRTAITEDLLELSEKLSPQHLRESAREVMRDAREEAKEVLREAKDAAIGSLRDIKDKAIHSVTDRVGLISNQAREAGSMTVRFVSANAVAFSLVGLGAGWLLIALRNRRRRETDYAYRFEHYSYPTEDARYPVDEPSDDVTLESTPRSLATRATSAVDHAREQVRSAGSRVASDLGHYGQRAGAGLRQAATRTRDLAVDNRVAAIALTVAAGLGIGLLLPVGQRPRRALRSAGTRAWDEAQSFGRGISSRARNVSGRREPPPSNWQLY